MSTEGRPFDNLMEKISQEVQKDFETGNTGGPTPPPAVPAPSAAPQPAAVAPGTTPAPTVGEKLLANKFRSVEELEKGHHMLIHNFNALKAQNDELLARVAAPQPAPTPLTPGRVDPARPVDRSDPEYQKWVEQYGIDPSDIDARIERRLAQEREAAGATNAAMQQADVYMAQTYPDFLPRVEDVKAFVVASPALKDRVAALWAAGHYAAAMEIGYLAYDNALRTTQFAQSANEATQNQVNRDRGDASMLSSQAGGSREVTPSADGYPRTPEDWQRIRDLRMSGREAEANRILYGPLIAHIPELNPRV